MGGVETGALALQLFRLDSVVDHSCDQFGVRLLAFGIRVKTAYCILKDQPIEIRVTGADVMVDEGRVGRGHIDEMETVGVVLRDCLHFTDTAADPAV